MAIIEIFKREVKLILNSLSFVNIVLKLSSCYSMVRRSLHFSFEKVRGRGGEGKGRLFEEMIYVQLIL